MTWHWFITSRIGGTVSAALAFVAALGAAYLKGRSRGRTDARQGAQERELKAHDRLNEADTGGGATDDERLKRLQRLGQEWDAS